MNRRQAFGQDIDNDKLSNIMLLIIVPISLLMVFLAMNNYSVITNNYLITNDYLSLIDRKYLYSDILKILYITKFKNKMNQRIENTSPYYIVIMKNGYKWKTLNLSINNTPSESEIINFISGKTGIPIIEGTHNINDI